MKPEALLVNVSRGGLVDTAALARRRSRRARSPEPRSTSCRTEPPDPGDPLLGAPNLLLQTTRPGTRRPSLVTLRRLLAAALLRLPRRRAGAERSSTRGALEEGVDGERDLRPHRPGRGRHRRRRRARHRDLRGPGGLRRRRRPDRRRPRDPRGFRGGRRASRAAARSCSRATPPTRPRSPPPSHGSTRASAGSTSSSTSPTRRSSAKPEELSLADWEQAFRINVTSYFLCCREAGRRMIARGRGGAIVNMCSIGGTSATRPRLAIPTASPRAAIVMMTKELAIEWARHGIRVNAIQPCQFLTPGLRHRLDDPELGPIREKFLSGIPLNRLGEPHEMVGPVDLPRLGRRGDGDRRPPARRRRQPRAERRRDKGLSAPHRHAEPGGPRRARGASEPGGRMRVLILGGTRFVGRHVARCCVERGAEVTLLHRGVTGEPIAGHDDGQRRPLAARRPRRPRRPSASTPSSTCPPTSPTGRAPRPRRWPGGSPTTSSSRAARSTGPRPELPWPESTPFGPIPIWGGYGHEKVASERLLWEAHAEGRFAVTAFRFPFILGPGNFADRESFVFGRLAAGPPDPAPRRRHGAQPVRLRRGRGARDRARRSSDPSVAGGQAYNCTHAERRSRIAAGSSSAPRCSASRRRSSRSTRASSASPPRRST